jgi:serine/threonine protein kinase
VSGLPIIPFDDLKDQRIIGVGGFGEVRSAKRKGGALVVLKTTRVAGSFDRSSIGKELGFLRDMVPHTHVARVLGVCVDMPDGERGIIMDYCEYGSLASFLKTLSKVRARVLVPPIVYVFSTCLRAYARAQRPGLPCPYHYG